MDCEIWLRQLWKKEFMEEVDHYHAWRKLLSLVGQEEEDENEPFYDQSLKPGILWSLTNADYAVV